MLRTASYTTIVAALAVAGLAASPGRPASATSDRGTMVDPVWDTSQPRGRTRVIDFTTDEGTMMSVDLAPAGDWLVFDLLGQVYRLPRAGGAARNLTADSGIAVNYHPRISPDGSKIAFISDRNGQNALWVMDADGANPRQIFIDPDSRISEPAWMPDGRSIVTSRAYPTPGRGWHRLNVQIWRFPLDGGAPTRVIGGTETQYNAPAPSADGREVFFHLSYFTGNRYGSQAGHRIQAIDLATGALRESNPQLAGGSAEQFRAVDPSAMAQRGRAEIAPLPSPDGRYLAFAREMPNSELRYRGHRYSPGTAIWLRDLRTGTERPLIDPVTKDLSLTHAMFSDRILPGYSWSRDGRQILYSEGGKIRLFDVRAGRSTIIPFRARVHRVISEAARGNIRISDGSFQSRFLQWPATSPDGSALLFVAAGQLWRSGPGRPPQALNIPAELGFPLTPAWSPDGQWIAFTTWSDERRGQVWRMNARSGELVRITTAAGEYINPAWSPDGRFLIVVKGPGPREHWNGWDEPDGWRVVRLALDGTERDLAPAGASRRASFGPDNRIYFEHQDDRAAAEGLWQPFPSDAALAQRVSVRSIDSDGGTPRDHLILPPARYSVDFSAQPMISPDGRWLAYQAGRNIYVKRLAGGSAVQQIDTDPNSDTGAIRVGDDGGIYHRWINATTLEFMSGSRHVTYDAERGQLRSDPITLSLPRATAQGVLRLQGARIVTLEGSQVIERGDIVVRNGRIACVGRCAPVAGETVINAVGNTIIPGFVDVHSHTGEEESGVIPQHRPASALPLAYGVTTAIDPSVSSASVFPLAELTETGRVVGPRLFTTAETVVAPAWGFGRQAIVRTLADAEAHVDRRASWGAATIKNFRNARRGQTQMLVEAARHAGVSITGEGGPLNFDVSLAMDGQTGWEHLLAPIPIYSDAARFFGQAGIFYSPTAIVAGHPQGSVGYFRPRQDLLSDPKYMRFAFAPDIRASTRFDRIAPLEQFSFPLIAEGLADIVRAGGHGAIGEHGEQFGIGSHWEIWAYASALTPLEALRVASLDGAYTIGLNQEVGSIRPGKLADLIVLTANPLENIRNTIAIRYVIKAGRVFEGDTLDERWPERRPFGHRPWARP